jgi:hypothetical protein
MFKSAGNFSVTIKRAITAKSKFNTTDPQAFDICIQVATDDGQEDWWRGEVSSKYGKGNYSDRTQAQITMETLQRVGYKHGYDLSKLNSLVGMKTSAWVKESKPQVCDDGVERVFYNVAGIGGNSNEPEAIDAAEAARRFAAMFPQSQQSAPPPVVQQQTQQRQTFDPFAQRA